MHHDERRHRTSRFQHALSNQSLDAVLLTNPDSIFYLSGYTNYLGMEFGRPTFMLVTGNGHCSIITPLMESEMCTRMTWVNDIRPWEDGDSEWRGVIERLLKEYRIRCLGMEQQTVAPVVTMFLDSLDGIDCVDATALLAEQRAVKSPAEIETMRQAGQVAIAMVDAARQTIGENVPEYEVALAVIAAGTRKAAEFLHDDEIDPFFSPTIYNLQVLQSGHDTCMVHRRSSVKRLQEGEPVYLCFCGIANFKGYKLGFDREFFIGTVDDKMAKSYETTLSAQAAALDAIRPGVVAQDVHAAANRVYVGAGLAPGYRTGRSIGCSFLENPQLKAGDKTPLQAGMTFAVDGGITVPGHEGYGTRVGDSIVVTENGFEYLTPYPKDLTIL